MMDSGLRQSNLRRRSTRGLLCALILVLVASLPMVGAATPAPHLNGAGLVIKHGDGRILYFYVQFSEPQITGAQLLERTGVSLDAVPYSGLGEAICLIDGEGCPSSNCFCKSYANPSVYWRYQRLTNAGQWVFIQSGPDQTIVHDGDVDGWAWSATNGDLPSTSIDQIAKLNGITRNQVPAISTPTSPLSPAATPIDKVAPVASSTATIAPATGTPRVLGVAVSSSGNRTSIDPTASHPSKSWQSYIWFGVGVLALLAVALVALLRRRFWPDR